jgi:hypothetical protein
MPTKATIRLQTERRCGFKCGSERISKRNLFGAHISGFPLEAKAVTMNGIRFAKEKGQMIAARPTRCATLAVVIQILIDAVLINRQRLHMIPAKS